jgi:hypothetical protein
VSTTPTIPDLSGTLDRLEALGSLLEMEREREDADDVPDIEVLRDAAVHVRVELDALGAIVEELGEWGAPTPILAAAYTVALENLGLAERSLQDVEGNVNPHMLLHGIRDALFHACRGVEGLRKLEDETMEESRRLSREENRQEFMSG